MTRFIAAYDTEFAGECLSACRSIRDVHAEFDFFATFFIVGKRLEEEGREYRDLLGDVPSFEIASHTYSHRMLRDHPFCGRAPGKEARLRELPGHGWHENLLKGHNLTDRIQRILAWPPQFPEAIPLGPVATPEEEFAIHRIFVTRAVELGLPYVSLIWHPWSLQRFDPEMRMLRLLFAFVQESGLESTTYEREWQRAAQIRSVV